MHAATIGQLFGRPALAIEQRLHGSEHADTLTTQDNLAMERNGRTDVVEGFDNEKGRYM